MDVDELKKLLADKTAKRDELPDVEFKESADSTFFESICSLANTWGGVVVLGVDKHGAIVGVPPTSEYLDKVTNQIVSLLSIHPKIEVVDNMFTLAKKIGYTKIAFGSDIITRPRNVGAYQR